MKRRLLIILLCVTAALCGVTAVACTGAQLQTPLNLRITQDSEGDVLSWREVDDAVNYIVEIDGESKQTRRTSFELSRFELGNGTYTVKVKACAKNFKDSEWAEISYEVNRNHGVVYTQTENGEYHVTAVGGANGEILIADEYKGAPVTGIADSAFFNSGKVVRVVMGKNVKTIGAKAFGNCSLLEEIVFAEEGTLTTIGDAAFQSCPSLGEIVLPDTVTYIGINAFAYCRNAKNLSLPSNLVTIDEGAFASCDGLTDLVIPASVEAIGTRAFAECVSLKNIAVQSTKAVIGSQAFFKCGENITEENPLTEENELTVDLGEGVTAIYSSAFMQCNALKKISVPDSVTYIGATAFAACVNLENIKLGSGITSIGGLAFGATKYWNNSSDYVIIDGWFVGLKNLDDKNGDFRSYDLIGIACEAFAKATLTNAYQLPASLLYINDYAFYKCSASSVTVGNGVKKIGNYAFSGCEFLRTVLLGNSVETIGDYAFSECKVLTATNSAGGKNINIPRSVKAIGFRAFYNTALWNNSAGMMVVDNWVVGCKPSASGSLDIPNGTVGIADGSFQECKSITGVYIPSTVVYIGGNAFAECSALKSIELPGGLKNIPANAFYKCSELTEVTIPNGVLTIGNNAFRNCTKLKSISIPDSVTAIGWGAFSFCDYLERVTMGNSVEEIGSFAFAYCTSLTEIELPDTLTEISDYLFYRSSSLTKVNFGNGVRTIGERAFYQCTLLSELNMPNSITSIGELAFYKCKALWRLQIGENVSEIGNYAFYGCENLRKVVIPDSVERLGSSAFTNCEKLEAVTLGVNLLSVGEHVFMNCSRLTVYAEASNAYSTWSSLWNSQYRPVAWGCTLSAEKDYVISVTVGEDTISNSNAANGITAPVRLGYTFAGWALTEGGEAVYTAGQLSEAKGLTLYAVWEEREAVPEIDVTPEYVPGWDTEGSEGATL